jgi:hypothetical protein
MLDRRTGILYGKIERVSFYIVKGQGRTNPLRMFHSTLSSDTITKTSGERRDKKEKCALLQAMILIIVMMIMGINAI